MAPAIVGTYRSSTVVRLIAGNKSGSAWRRREIGGRIARLRVAGVVALAAGIAGLLLSAGVLGGRVEDRLGQFVLFHLRGALPSPPEVIVVAEDRPPPRRWDSLPGLGRGRALYMHPRLRS